MRRITTVVALVAALGVAGVCLAKEKKNGSTSGVVANSKQAKADPAAKPATISEKATITKIDGANVTFTIQMPADAGTKITVDSVAKTLADLKAGQTAMVTFNENTLTAISVISPADATPASAAPAASATPADPAKK